MMYAPPDNVLITGKNKKYRLMQDGVNKTFRSMDINRPGYLRLTADFIEKITPVQTEKHCLRHIIQYSDIKADAALSNGNLATVL